MSQRRLLVVDDEADFARFVRRVAQRLDFTVEMTTRARDFKEAYERFQPSVIVLDIVMPEADGIELIQWLASKGCEARVLIISGYDPRYAVAAELLGNVGGKMTFTRLRKPILVADLEKALAGVSPA